MKDVDCKSCETCWDFWSEKSLCANPFNATYHSTTGAVYAIVRPTDVCGLWREDKKLTKKGIN